MLIDDDVIPLQICYIYTYSCCRFVINNIYIADLRAGEEAAKVSLLPRRDLDQYSAPRQHQQPGTSEYWLLIGQQSQY